jgi:hypothetical protein
LRDDRLDFRDGRELRELHKGHLAGEQVRV